MTWTLSSNPIALMHGPTFLIFYYITVISIWFSFQGIIKKRVEKNYFVQPLESNIDPNLLAWLRSGEEGLLLLCLSFMLENKHIEALKGNKLRTISSPKSKQLLNKTNMALLEHFSVPAGPETAYPLITNLNLYCRQKALNRNLIFDKKEKQIQCNLILLVITIIWALAIYKIIIAINNGHENIVILILSMFFLTFSFLLFNREKWREPPLTPEGRDYLQRMEKLLTNAGGDKNKWLISILSGASLTSLNTVYYLGSSIIEYSDTPVSDSHGGDYSGGDSCGGDSCGGSGCGGCGGGD